MGISGRLLSVQYSSWIFQSKRVGSFLLLELHRVTTQKPAVVKVIPPFGWKCGVNSNVLIQTLCSLVSY